MAAVEFGAVRTLDKFAYSVEGPRSMRTIRRNQSTECSAPGCTVTTQERKPYCIEHVTLNSYVASVTAQLEEADDEVARILRHGAKAARHDGHLARRILAHLPGEGVTMFRIALDFGIDREVIKHVVNKLRREKLVRTRNTRRGLSPLVTAR